jgi:hypothetical protein
VRAVGAKPGRKGTAAISLAMLYGALALNAGSACAQTTEPTIGQLQQEIKKRDALIENLLQRVEKLERRVGTTAAANHTAPVVAQRAVPPQPSASPTQVAAARRRLPLQLRNRSPKLKRRSNQLRSSRPLRPRRASSR